MRLHSETDLWLQFLTCILAPQASCHVGGLIERTLKDPFFKSWLMLAELYFHVIFINKKLSNALPPQTPLADLTTRQSPFINKQMKSFSFVRRTWKFSTTGLLQEPPGRQTEFLKEYLCQPSTPSSLGSRIGSGPWLLGKKGGIIPKIEKLLDFLLNFISHSRKHTINRITTTTPLNQSIGLDLNTHQDNVFWYISLIALYAKELIQAYRTWHKAQSWIFM